jgi:2-oxoglutarate dehydrogenase complex dehydrogenase (E1) component-like enzyme
MYMMRLQREALAAGAAGKHPFAPRTYSADQKKRILERLTAAETLERYLHTKYVGQKRFSLEGGESLIVAMDEAIRRGGNGY